MATLHTQHREMSIFDSITWLNDPEEPVLTAATVELIGGGVWQKMRSNKLQDKQALLYYLTVTRLPSTALNR